VLQTEHRRRLALQLAGNEEFGRESIVGIDRKDYFLANEFILLNFFAKFDTQRSSSTRIGKRPDDRLQAGKNVRASQAPIEWRRHRPRGAGAVFPAVDTAWGAGVAMIAPEACKVDTKDTSAAPGEALYLTGWSLMRYWIAHIDRDLPLGHRFAKGEVIGKTVDTDAGGGPHGHVGVNAEAFLGKGKQLKYGRLGNGPDYTTGAPTIRKQLEGLEI
jgi:hypothetical protein